MRWETSPSPNLPTDSAEEAYPEGGFELFNAAGAGDTAVNLRKRLAADVLVHEPDLVVICIGTSDCNGSRKPEEHRADLEALVTKLDETGSRVMLVRPSPFGDAAKAHGLPRPIPRQELEAIRRGGARGPAALVKLAVSAAGRLDAVRRRQSEGDPKEYAYGRTTFEAPAAGDYELQIGSSPNPQIVWVHGVNVWEGRRNNGYHPIADRTMVRMNAGRNEIVVAGNFMLFLGIEPPAG